MIVNKRYSSAFVVDRSKMTRLMGVIKNSITHEATSYEEFFEVRLRGAKTITIDSLQHVLDLDNSERSRIERLSITCRTRQVSNDEPRHSVEVDFDGLRPVDITITVMSDDPKLAADIMSVAEEQVERMLERSLMYWLYGGYEGSFLFLGILPIFIIVAGLTALLSLRACLKSLRRLCSIGI
jgi:hypothetical protein